jgi:hypothetical protein
MKKSRRICLLSVAVLLFAAAQARAEPKSYARQKPSERTSSSIATAPHIWGKGHIGFIADGMLGGGFAVGSDFNLWGKSYKNGVFVVRLGPQFATTFAGLAPIAPNVGSATLIDIAAAARPAFLLGLPNGDGLLFYAQIPIGLSIGVTQPSASGQGGGKVGAGIVAGVLPGVEYFVTPNFGIFAELGYMYHGNKFPTSSYTNTSSGAFNGGLTYVF